MKKRLEALKEALNNVAKKLWFILIKPVYKLKGKCLQALLQLAATTTKSLEPKLVKLTKKLAAMELF